MMPKYNDKDVKIETKIGQGPGGQHRNKTSSCVVATHVPTNISVTIDGRNQHQNKRKAKRLLRKRVEDFWADQKAQKKKERRDEVIHDTKRIRTYDFKAGIVKDHRTGKVASLKDVLIKGRLDLLK
jgi:protein subunit release factor A